jgi:hypothetical protein
MKSLTITIITILTAAFTLPSPKNDNKTPIAKVEIVYNEIIHLPQ